MSNRARAAGPRRIVQAQLDAFAAGDAYAAFAYASPGIRAAFGTPEAFMAMVRRGYPAVIAPRTATFLVVRVVDGVTYQPVRLIDSDGRAWLALYRMLRREDGTWRIDGCRLARAEGAAT